MSWWRAPVFRSAALVAAAVVSTGRAGAQAPPRFATQAELVTIDVVVLGPDGKPVSGLTRDDFVVEEDGRPQAIAAFEAVEALVPGVESPETVRSSPSQARIATNVAGPPTRRTFAIVFDDLHIGDVNVEAAKRAIATFVARQTVPGDRVVLATVGDARFWATTRGGEEAAWREALSRVRSRAPLRGRPGCEPTYYEAMQIDLMGNKRVADMLQRRYAALCVPPTTRASPQQLAQMAIVSDLEASGVTPASGASSGPPASSGGSLITPSAPEAYSRYRGRLAGTLRIVRQIILKLAETPGRKSVVLVSEGFPTDTSLDVFREVREEAARANVVLHFLDARGLAVGPDFLSAAGTTGLIATPDIGPTVAMWRLEDGGAKALAQETGGLVLQTNDLVAGLTQIADESRVTYLLGYEPTNGKRDGRYRKLGVEVRRAGLQVRARTGYFAPKGNVKPTPAPATDPVERALGGLFDADGIPLRLAAYVMGEAPVQSPLAETGFEVLIAGEVRLDALEAQMRDGRRVAEPRLKLLTSSRAGESHESEWSLQVTLGPSLPETGEALWHPFVTRIAMSPGDHRARLVVESGDRLGSVTVDFVVPPPATERLSTPILSDRLVANASGRRLLPLARRAFDATSTLHGWIELEGAALDTGTGEPHAQASFVARTLDGREWASGPATAMNVERGLATRLVSIPLGNAPPGEHELVLRVKDEISGATFDAREPFRVEGWAAGRAHGATSPPDHAGTPSAPSSGVATVSTHAPQPAATQAAPPPPPPPAPLIAAPTFPAATQVVLLDLVARDGQGRPVTDLRRHELEVLEDGRRCEVQSFRFVRAAAEGDGAPPGAGEQTATAAPPREASSPSRANVVVLLFDALSVVTAPSVRQAALDLLGRPFPPNTWFTVYKVTWGGTRMLQPLTSHRRRLRDAVLSATTGDDAKRFGRGVEPKTAETPSLAAGLLGPPSSSAGDVAARAGKLEQAHFRGREELATFSGIQGIVSSLADVRGRKAIVYFAADHELGGGEIGGGRASLVYEAAMSDANRANVTIHTVDARGLTASRVGGRSAFDEVVGTLSAAGATGSARGAAGTDSWTASTEQPDTPGPMLGDPDTLRQVRDRFLPYKSGSLLEHVAEETGGLAIRNTNDLAGGLARVIDELREYYEVAYTPPNPLPDGRFRRIRAKVSRPGVEVRTRAGYFATPATTPTVSSFELTLIAALAQDEPPRGFPHEVRLVPHGWKGGDREIELLAEVPLRAMEVARDAARGTYGAHLSFVGFIKDDTGRPVVRLSLDWPVEGKLDETGRPPQASLVLRRVMSLPPGRYTVESAIQDRRTGRISVSRTQVDVAPAATDAR